MRRRVLLQTFWAVTAALPFRSLKAWAQTAVFPGPYKHTLRELAATVLPESLGREGTDRIAEQFTRWVLEYRPGAEMQSGYGVTRIRQLPPSPARRYMDQLAELSRAALMQPDIAARRRELTIALKAAQIKDLPNMPDGKSIIADLMSFYFGSSEANDLAYDAAIRRDKCRTLKNSERAPTPIKAGPNAGH